MTDESKGAGEDPDVPAAARPLTPEARRASPEIAGTPAVLADGRTWLLHPGGLATDLDDLRDRLCDDLVLRKGLAGGDVVEAAWRLLRANYAITPPEAVALLKVRAPGDADGVALDDLAAAVLSALFGHTNHVTYTLWAESALWAAGLDPGAIPHGMVPWVLRHLEQTGRCAPRKAWLSSAEFQDVYAPLEALAKRQAAERERAGRAPLGAAGATP